MQGDITNSVRCKSSRHFRGKKGECMKDKTNELEINTKNRNNGDLYIGINNLKMSSVYN
jgi:hypothetical protein